MPKTKAPHPTDKYVGARVREARLAAQLSQEGLADMLGITFQQVQKNEKGINRIGASRLHEISAATGKPISWFFEGAPLVKLKAGRR
jgi:transcriptional regulator with XRE-family HTH domain